MPPFDVILVIATLLVAAVGRGDGLHRDPWPLLAQGDDPKTFLKKQGLFVVLGVVTMVVLALFDYRRLEPLAIVLYWLIVLSLVGRVPGGQQRARARPAGSACGPLQLQPSEFAVLALILAVASYCARRRRTGPGLARRVPPVPDAAIPIFWCCCSPTSAPP